MLELGRNNMQVSCGIVYASFIIREKCFSFSEPKNGRIMVLQVSGVIRSVVYDNALRIR